MPAPPVHPAASPRRACRPPASHRSRHARRCVRPAPTATAPRRQLGRPRPQRPPSPDRRRRAGTSAPGHRGGADRLPADPDGRLLPGARPVAGGRRRCVASRRWQMCSPTGSPSSPVVPAASAGRRRCASSPKGPTSSSATSTPTTARRLVEEVADPERLLFLRTDVAEEDDVESLIGAAVERFGGLDVLFNNAGVGGAFGPITETSVEDWDRTFAVLVRSVFLGIKHGARAMIEQGRGGSIINTASVAGLGGGAGPQAYSAAKAAVINLTYNTAVELSRTASASTPSARA